MGGHRTRAGQADRDRALVSGDRECDRRETRRSRLVQRHRVMRDAVGLVAGFDRVIDGELREILVMVVWGDECDVGVIAVVDDRPARIVRVVGVVAREVNGRQGLHTEQPDHARDDREHAPALADPSHLPATSTRSEGLRIAAPRNYLDPRSYVASVAITAPMPRPIEVRPTA